MHTALKFSLTWCCRCKHEFIFLQGYAGSEEVLGKCLQGRRQDAIIATKFGFREGIHTPPYTAVQIDEAITKSLRKLETTYIDLLQVLWTLVTTTSFVSKDIAIKMNLLL